MPINPIEIFQDKRSEELAQAREVVGGAEVRELRRSLSNPYARSDKSTELSQTDLGALIGVSSWGIVSNWENGRKPIGEDPILTIHRMRGVIIALPEFEPMEKYLFLVHPREEILRGVSVPPIELLRMQTSMGYEAVLHAIHVNSPTPESYRALAPEWRIRRLNGKK